MQNMETVVDNFSLHRAVEDQSFTVVRALVQSVDVNEKNSEGNTPLHVAVRNYSPEFLKRSLDGRNRVEKTSQLKAAIKTIGEILKLLLDAKDTDLNVKDNNGYTPLLLATEYDYGDIEAMLRHNKDESVYSDNVTAEDYFTLPSWLVKNVKETVLKLLLDAGAYIEAKNKSGNTAVHIAAIKGDEFIINLLLKEGANVNAKNNVGHTPLYLAAQKGKEGTVKLLIKSGADVNEVGFDEKSAIHVASEKGFEGIAGLLLDAGAEVDCKESTMGNTPLHVVALYRRKNIIKMLIEAEADVNIVNDEGITAWLYVVQQTTSDLEKMLIDAGTNMNYEDSNGSTLLHYAAEKNIFSVIETLLSHGIDVNVKNKLGRTPLHCAVMSCKNNSHLETIEKLFKHGAKYDVFDSEDKIPQDYLLGAEMSTNLEVVPVFFAEISAEAKKREKKRLIGKIFKNQG